MEKTETKEKREIFMATPHFAALATELLRGGESGYRRSSIRSLVVAHISRRTLTRV